MQVNRRNATLAVIEFSAVWPRWLKPRHSGDMAVIAREQEVDPLALMTEISTRATRLVAMNYRLSSVVLVSNGLCHTTPHQARNLLVQGLLTRLRSQGGGHLLLTVDASAGTRAQEQLRTLAKSFARVAVDSRVELGVRVGDAVERYALSPLPSEIARAG